MKELLKQALDALMCCSPDSEVGAALQIKTVADLRAELAQPAYSLDTLDHIGYQGRESRPDELAQPNPWRDAIDAQLFCLHLGTVDSFPSAKFALAALIDWHVQVALDPEVSSDAQALIDRGRAAVAESLSDDELRECFTGTNTAEPLSEGWPGLKRFARAVEQAHGIGIKGSKT